MIKIQNVSKIFSSKDRQVKAVENVDLEIHQGEIFGVIGYSGAGKSTLIRMLNGLEKPTDGKVLVGEKAINLITGGELRKARQEIGMIFQHFNLLWSRTVAQNIAFPLEIAGVPKNKREERVAELIKLVGLEGRGDAYPSQLSGGQKQRVGIARALANNPKVLLCDEATSALDPETTDSILDLLVDINEKLGLTIVLITHEMHVIKKICHRVAVMEGGKVVELGDVIDVFERPQKDITKRFVQQITEEKEDTIETFDHLAERYPSGKIIKLNYLRSSAEQPIVNRLIKEYDLTINIVQGTISQTHKGAYGTLYLHVDGSEEEITRATSFLLDQQVEVEVLVHA